MKRRDTVNATKTDDLSGNGVLDDAITQLRVWGTRTIYRLDPANAPIFIGKKSGCGIRIPDGSDHASRVHAELNMIGGRWWLTNRSKNGTSFDGAVLPASALEPGVEIGMASTKFVAESDRLVELRHALERMIGWHERYYESIDVAVSEIRLAAARRAILVLHGQAHLSAVAAELHELTLGRQRPFVLCRLTKSRDTEDISAESFRSARAALAAAAGGTVCVSGRPPGDLREMLLEMRAPGCRTQLVVCAEAASDATLYRARPVEITPLSYRSDELDTLIDEYAKLAARQPGMTQFHVAPAERSWIKKEASNSLTDIKVSVRRVALLRRVGSVSAAASELGVSRNSLWIWFERRKFRQYVPLAKR